MSSILMYEQIPGFLLLTNNKYVQWFAEVFESLCDFNL